MEKAANYTTSVHPAWVRCLIKYHAPGSGPTLPSTPTIAAAKYLIFETHLGQYLGHGAGLANTYLRHIPGAIHSNSDTYENGYPAGSCCRMIS
jgi:thiosulfate/3-mercaptopyruvate sulfurtransferase